MYLYPSDIFEKLEFDKILERLSVSAMGQPAHDLMVNMKLFNNKKRIEQMLDEVLEYLKCIEMQFEFPIVNYSSIIDELRLLRTVDYVLEIDSYIKLYVHIKSIYNIVIFFKEKERKEALPILYNIASQIEINEALLQKFDRIFTDDGKIKPTASPELKKIFSAISSKERELEQVFKSLIAKYKKSGLLNDSIESYKNSRRVLTVNAENKRKVKGIIHDESGTGKTVFIEPDEVMGINNDLFELEASKRHEVYKILKSLSNDLRPYLDDFLLWQRILVRYDVIRSKALFSKSYNGIKPKIVENGEIEVKEGYHPLLFILNEEQGKKTVPFSLKLNNENRILVISGPNAGGKSVTLKALGLNQLMLQAGILIPVNEDSSFKIFSKVMIDIGDQQSLEGDLSTYSSRLIHMKNFIDKADQKSLVLMDEFGSGSDPKMGGAIAEAVLHKLVAKKCNSLITTHYSNIKNYAYKSKHIVNGAMLFDKEELQPTYILKTGQPGSSFAFEIANKIGLGKDVLKYAKNKAGKDTELVDRLLVDLQDEKKQLDEQLLNAFDEQHRLKKLIENYEKMKDDLDIRRKKLKLEAREKKYLNISDYEKELQKLIKEIKEEKNLEKAKNISKGIKAKKADTKDEISNLTEEVFNNEISKVKDLKIGQFVKLRSGGDPGKVIDFNDKRVKLEMGLLQFEVPRSELMLSDRPIESRSKSITTDTKYNPSNLESKLDIRGYTRQDALDSIEEFLDNSLMSSATMLKVLHGKGSGVLKKTLWTKAKEYKDIKKIWHPEEEFGGTGVTYISF
ncbi:MAG: endonuclease MutS2 [Saprospiraceae bacterium]|nr:endonuclease MutS2 [Saprospiraceae bacterium]